MKKRKIKVFIATPSDLTEEREAFRNILELLNEGFGDGANIEFEALGWENEYASTGRRVQSLFNTYKVGTNCLRRCSILFVYRRRVLSSL
jgi:hypothetical protein